METKLCPLEDWLTTDIVVEMLNISERTLQKLRSNGKIGYSQFGTRCYYKRAEIEAFMEANYKPAR